MNWSPMTAPDRLNNLQILRFAAAMLVVLHHVIWTSSAYGLFMPALDPLTGWGESGVDLFFVISGFVMVYIQALRPRSAATFFLNRVARILPLYWLLSLLLLSLFFAVPQFFASFETTWQRSIASFFFSTTFLLRELPVLFVGWTLEYEMLFYALFALGMVFGRLRLAILFSATGLLAAVFAGVMNPLALEFIFGMACAALSLSGYGKRFAWFFLGLGVILLASWIWARPDLDRLWSFGLPALLIVLGVANIRQAGSNLLTYLGDASYSIYLVQVFTIPAIYKLAVKLPVATPTALVALTAILATIATGCLLFRYVEQPALARFRRII